MNKDFNTFIILFVAIVLGVVFYQAIDNTVSSQVNTYNAQITNQTQIFRNGTGNATSLNSLQAIVLSGVIVINATGGQVVPANNYSVTAGSIIADSNSAYINKLVNVTAAGVYQSTNYITDTSARTIETILLLITALGFVIFIISYLLKNGSLGRVLGK